MKVFKSLPLTCSLLMLSPSLAQANAWLLSLEGGWSARSLSTEALVQNADANLTAALPAASVGSTLAKTSNQANEHGSIWSFGADYEWTNHTALMAAMEFRVNWDNFDEVHRFSGASAQVPTAQVITDMKYRRGTQYELVGRLGVKGGRSWIPYVFFGGAMGRDNFDYAIQFIDPAYQQSDSLSEKHTKVGWIVGTGFEWAMLQDSIVPMFRNSTFRVEYQYTQDERYTMNDSKPPFTGAYSVKPHRHALKLGFVVKWL